MSSSEIITLKGRIDSLNRWITADEQRIGKIQEEIIENVELRDSLSFRLERLCVCYEELNEKGEYK